MTPVAEHDIPYVLALLSLPKVGPNRLAALLELGSAGEVWERLRRGEPCSIESVRSETVDQWRRAARLIDVDDRWRALEGLGIELSTRASPAYPRRLHDDPEPPFVLFARGTRAISGPSVGLVGTRRCTAYGRRVAFELGAELSRAGVAVISGLAAGIDAAAHEGALSVSATPPVGVVGSGLDVVYPRQNRDLWHRVAEHGLLLSEAPPGSPPERWRFPARNRIIAGLADAVVVVESHVRGGALLTADEAALRARPVGAVPGPITAASSVGTNALIADGAVPVMGADDIFLMIDHVPPRSPAGTHPDPGHDDAGSELLRQMGFEPLLFEQLCLLSGRSAAEVAIEVEALVAAGRATRSGAWIERVR